MTDVLTTQQVADLLQLHRYTVTAMLRDGRLRGVRTGDGRNARWRISRQALDEYLGVRARGQSHAGALRAADV